MDAHWQGFQMQSFFPHCTRCDSHGIASHRKYYTRRWKVTNPDLALLPAYWTQTAYPTSWKCHYSLREGPPA